MTDLRIVILPYVFVLPRVRTQKKRFPGTSSQRIWKCAARAKALFLHP
jgi:hypothetical protein